MILMFLESNEHFKLVSTFLLDYNLDLDANYWMMGSAQFPTEGCGVKERIFQGN